MLKREVILGGGLEPYQPPYKKNRPLYKSASIIEFEYDKFKEGSNDLIPEHMKKNLEKMKHRKNIKNQNVRDIEVEVQKLVEY